MVVLDSHRKELHHELQFRIQGSDASPYASTKQRIDHKDRPRRRRIRTDSPQLEEQGQKEGYAAPGNDAVPDDWSTQDKFLVVVETASLNETELAEYARKKGLYVEQIHAWKDACMNANGGIAKDSARLSRELKQSQKECKKLEKELKRKDKALAEAAALLVLSKKANAIWGDPEDGQ